MLPEQQQRILGYFIEEARDHLNTIEQGLLNLQSTLNDPELINELFRAAHSIKGGAAMLGLTSIQHISHRLEDSFKVLKENPIRVDQKLESLLLGVSDTLKALLEQLSGPFGLSEEAANTLMSETEPVFQWLNEHLELLVQQGAGTGDTSATVIQPKSTETVGTTITEIFFRQDVPTGGEPTPQTASSQAASAPATSTAQDHWAEFQTQVLQKLREMLQLFKQQPTPASRQQLQQCCNQLQQMGQTWNLPNWCNLCKAAATAIGNSENSYLTLAKIVITEIKQAQELVQQGREAEITISQQLEALWGFSDNALLEVAQNLLGDIPSAVQPSLISPATSEVTDNTDNTYSTITKGEDSNITVDLPTDSITSLTEVSEQLDPHTDISETTENTVSEHDIIGHLISESEAPISVHTARIDAHGPEVGLAELNTLADLFEGETPELDDNWQQEEIIEITDSSALGVDIGATVIQEFDSDLADFLSLDGNNDEIQSSTKNTEDLSLLFGENLLQTEDLATENLQNSPAISEEILQEHSPNTEGEQDENDDLEEFLHLEFDASNSPTSKIIEIENNHSSQAEVAPKSSNELDDLFSENELKTEDLARNDFSNIPESKSVESPEDLSLDNLFTEVQEIPRISIDESEINDLFDEQPITVLDFSADEDDLSNFWSEENTAESELILDDVDEHDLAKELEESLFTDAASGESFGNVEDSANSGLESFDAVDLNETFLPQEEQLDLMFSSEDTEDNLFEDLAASESTINQILSEEGEIFQPETPGFSQAPESLDFIPEFTNQNIETSAGDSNVSFADVPFDLFSLNDGNSEEESLENIDNPFDDLFAKTNDIGLEPQQDTEGLNNHATSLETDSTLADVEEISELSSGDNLLPIDTQLSAPTFGEWVIPISEVTDVEFEDTSLDIGDELLETIVQETSELDLAESFLGIEADVSEVSGEDTSFDIGDELLETIVQETPELDLAESFLGIEA
uniref:Hpt domain-containing protein n=1 Tax=Anabaena sp. 4-3 TaxID=1811979 RepID=UPI000B299C5A